VKRRGSNGSEILARKPKTFSPVVLNELTSLFDNHKSKSMEANLGYMASHFSFFVPDIDYLKDPLGFALYLADKVGNRHQCVFCNKLFSSLSAVRSHMRDQGHTMLGTDDPDMARDARSVFQCFSSSSQYTSCLLFRIYS
jgi:pre-60S factor REI1